MNADRLKKAPASLPCFRFYEKTVGVFHLPVSRPWDAHAKLKPTLGRAIIYLYVSSPSPHADRDTK